MSKLEQWKSEIKRAGLLDIDSDYNGMIGKALIRMCETVSKEGHSGFSFSLTTHIFNKLMTTGILTPLTGEDDEWVEVEGDIYQNIRASNVFKDKNGKAYQVDYYIFHDKKDDDCGYTNGKSFKYIKFPYWPAHEHKVVKNRKKTK